MAYSELGYDSGNNLTVSFLVDNKSSTKDEFDVAIKKQDEKPDATLPASSEHIKAENAYTQPCWPAAIKLLKMEEPYGTYIFKNDVVTIKI